MSMFQKFGKIPRITNERFFLSEKIDGTNACVNIQIASEHLPPFGYEIAKVDNHRVFAQSRTRMITPSNDNFGFAKWVEENAEALCELGAGYHYGEWWGGKIQRGYGLEEKVFSLFNPTVDSSATLHVPQLASDIEVTYHNLHEVLEEQASLLRLNGSVAAKGFMNPEGIIIYSSVHNSYWKYIINK